MNIDKNRSYWFLLLLIILVNMALIAFDFGSPLLNVLLALPMGYELNKGIVGEQRQRFNKAYLSAISISLSSLIMMLWRWFPLMPLLDNPLMYGTDFIYQIVPSDPLSSLILWMVLVIFIFPILQLVSLLCGGILAILYK